MLQRKMTRYFQPQVSTAGLVFSMPMTGNFTAGVLLYDESGSGFDGTATNGPVPKYPGFDFVAGSSHYIDIGTGPTTTKTIALWIKQDDVAGDEYPIDLNGTDYLSIESGVVTVNGLAGHSLYVNGASGTSGVTTITAGVWHHIAITDSTANDASDLDIGRVTAAYYDGLIADVLLYNRVLLRDEVASLYFMQRHKYQKQGG